MERSDKYTQKPRAKEIFSFSEAQPYRWSAATKILTLVRLRMEIGGKLPDDKKQQDVSSDY